MRSTILAAKFLKALCFARRKMTGLIPYGPAFISDKVCEELPPDRTVTPAACVDIS